MRHERLQLERGSSQQQGKRESTKYVQGFKKKGCVESSGVVAGEESEKIGAGSKKISPTENVIMPRNKNCDFQASGYEAKVDVAKAEVREKTESTTCAE